MAGPELRALDSAGHDGPPIARMVVLGIGILATAAAFFSLLFLPPAWGAGSLLVLAGAAIGYLSAIHLYRRRLQPLREGIIAAQEGILQPIGRDSNGDGFIESLYKDYNDTVTILGSMFKLVEECQNRMVNERNRMNVIVQAMPAAVLGVDDDLCVNMANRHAEVLFDYRPGSLVGIGLFDLLHFDESDRDEIRDAFLYKQSVRNRIFNLPFHGGDAWLSINLSFLTEREGDMTAILTLLDITDYKHLQETVYNREKLVAMGQLAAGVAHELNTPLGTIFGHAQLLEGTTDPDAAREAAKIITDEARRCTGIIRNLLNYTRRDRCQDGVCDVNDLVNDLVDTFMSCRLKSSHVVVERRLDASQPRVRMDCGELDIVLTNILLNAIQATEARSDAHIEIQTLAVGDSSVELIIEDNGPGVPRNFRSRIFEPFFTTKDVGEGSGMGLSISHALLEKRGGTIKYDSAYDEGARFLIRLPAVTTNTAIN